MLASLITHSWVNCYGVCCTIKRNCEFKCLLKNIWVKIPYGRLKRRPNTQSLSVESNMQLILLRKGINFELERVIRPCGTWIGLIWDLSANLSHSFTLVIQNYAYGMYTLMVDGNSIVLVQCFHSKFVTIYTRYTPLQD